MNDKLTRAREQLGLFFKERREEMGHPVEVVAAAVGISASTVNRIEAGSFAWDVDMHHAIMRELQIKPYFTALDEPDTEDYRNRKEDDPERYHGFYISDNELLYPGQLAIVKLTFPRVFVRFIYEDTIFVTYNEWKQHIITIQWLDPADKPNDESTIDEVLTDCWNFLALDEGSHEA